MYELDNQSHIILNLKIIHLYTKYTILIQSITYKIKNIIYINHLYHRNIQKDIKINMYSSISSFHLNMINNYYRFLSTLNNLNSNYKVSTNCQSYNIHQNMMLRIISLKALIMIDIPYKLINLYMRNNPFDMKHKYHFKGIILISIRKYISQSKYLKNIHWHMI